MSRRESILPRPSYRCRDCRVDTDEIGEYSYMLKDRIWKLCVRRALRASPGKASMRDLCCIGCVERRLGRRLTRVDFDWTVPLVTMPDSTRSRRLLNRMAAA